MLYSGCVIYEWDIATGMFTRSLIGHTRPLTCLSVSSVGNRSTDQCVVVAGHCKQASECIRRPHCVCLVLQENQKYVQGLFTLQFGDFFYTETQILTRVAG